MAEREEYSFVRVSQPLTDLLIKGDISPALTKAVQTELNAYFPFKKDTFGGVLYHRDGKGPEKPYFMPDGTDWLPKVQAIARIGVQHHYWDMLHTTLEQQRINPAKWMSMSILVLCINSDGSSFLPIVSESSSLRRVAREAGDKEPVYPGYVLPVNFGGDPSFYGSDRNSIFPMGVRRKRGKTNVQRETLGIPSEMIEHTWMSWKGLEDTADSLYHEAVVSCCRLLPDPYVGIIEKEIARGWKISGVGGVVRALLREDHGLSDEVLRIVTAIPDNKAREIMTGNTELLTAAKAHAGNLLSMYETAKRHCQDIYHY